MNRAPLKQYAWLSLIRAWGVILVLGFHFFPWLVPGGFIGVDVFFVFSGYLITSLLVREFREQGKVRLGAFYVRRFRRLFPALAAMVVLTLALALLIPEDFRANLVRQTAAALSWTTNIYEILTGGSYANALLPHLFVHTWTLSIEMQFYLVWGAALTIILPLFVGKNVNGKRSVSPARKTAALIAGVVALASFVAMQLLVTGADDPSVAYYSTASHAFPLFIGSALGALSGFNNSRLAAVATRLAAPVAIGLVAVCLAAIAAMALLLPFDNPLVYRGGILATSLLVAIIIWLGRGAQHRLALYREPALLSYVADRSYSLYLFHWPFMIIALELARHFFGVVEVGANPLYVGVALVALALTFCAAHLSYRFLEQGFRARAAHPVQGHSTQGLPMQAHLAHSAQAQAHYGAEAHVKSTGSRFAPRAHKLIVAALAAVLAVPAALCLAFAPTQTSIEGNYQRGLLALDVRQLGAAHEALLHTGAGGNVETEGRGVPGFRVKPGSVTILGDSVTILPAELLIEATGAYVEADVGLAMVNGIRILKEIDATGNLGETVVVALATNAHEDSFSSAVTICEQLSEGRRLIFVTSYGQADMDALSEELRSLPARYPYVSIADWNKAVRGREDLLAADGYHLANSEAIDLYVQVVRGAIEEAKNKPTR